jgi:hypothetical protein
VDKEREVWLQKVKSLLNTFNRRQKDMARAVLSPPFFHSTEDVTLIIGECLAPVTAADEHAECAMCGQTLFDKRMYSHENGWLVPGYSEKQWVYFHCEKCKYDTSLDKLGVSR